ncbi:MAG: putative sulfate exporter family transporter [Thermodesulfovibrionales bacterium]
MGEKKEQSQDIVVDKPVTQLSDLWKKEDYWAIWLGSILLIVGILIYFNNAPKDMEKRLETANAVLKAESERAPFKTVAWHEANDEKGKIAGANEKLPKEIASYLARPHDWNLNPIESFIRTKEEADAKAAANKEKFEKAKAAAAEAKTKAKEMEKVAAEAQFKDENLNKQAIEAIAAWRKAQDAASKARRAAEAKPYNIVGSLVVLCIATGLFFTIGNIFMGRNIGKFLLGFPIVFILAVLAYMLAAQATFKAWGLEYVLWAIILGFLISNTIGTPKWLLEAAQTEYYIKTGLVLLGSSILINKILLIGIPGFFVTWVVTPIVLIVTYWFGQNILKMTSKTLNITVSADMSVCGVSAAIATAAACRAKKEELTLAVGMSITFTAIMMITMPAFIKAIGMHHVLGGAWMGGTIDSTGAVVAAGAILSDTAMYVAATIKMIQNMMIGVIAFGVATYWALKVDMTPGVKLSIGSALNEIWARFPKFVLGFLGASVVFSLIHQSLGKDVGKVLIDDGVIRGWTSALQGWFFCLAFVSIGLSTDFRDLAKYFKGGKPLILYVCGQSFNLFLTLAMAYVMFFVVFPDITEKLVSK